ncbi:MAG: hypothetical protein MI723_17010 [Caulobacterales bacterium]|nr:hypothetical protein [Caulobacterales bacterium]
MASLDSILDPLVAAAAAGIALAEKGRASDTRYPVHGTRSLLAAVPLQRRARAANGLSRALQEARENIERWLQAEGRPLADLEAGMTALNAWLSQSAPTTAGLTDIDPDATAIAEGVVIRLAADDPRLYSDATARDVARTIVASAVAAARHERGSFADLADVLENAAPSPAEAPAPAAPTAMTDLAALARARANLAEMSRSLASAFAPAAAERAAAPQEPAVSDNLPSFDPQAFWGRSGEITALHDALNYRRGRAAAIVAASGRSGVGASSLALAYCARYRQTYERVWWIRAGARTTMLSDLAELAAAVDPAGAPPADAPGEAAQAIDLMSRRAGERPTLLVYDDAPPAR